MFLRRLDKAFKAFFRRIKAGENPGYPRFRGRGWYKSFTYPQVCFKLDGSKLTLSKIGSIRIFKHRERSRLARSRRITQVIGMLS